MNDETRDRLNAFVARTQHASVDAAIAYLLDEAWRNNCLVQAEWYRAEHPVRWRQELAYSTENDRTLSGNLDGKDVA